MKTSPALVALVLSALTPLAARAQFAPANAPPVFYVTPTSAVGTITSNTLTLTPLANGFTVAGQLQITVPPAPFSGILATWTVIRRIDPNYSSTNNTTLTSLTGFSTPPAGTFATSSGSVVTDWRFSIGGPTFVGGSQSSLPMTLVNGVDSPAWNSLSATSSPFVWTAGFFPDPVLQQQFTLSANYLTGPGGLWTIDVPVTSLILTPEPTTLLAACGLAVLTLRRRYRRR